MGNDRKTHLTGNKKRPEIDRNIKPRKNPVPKNSRFFKTVPSRKYLSVRSVDERMTDGRRTRFGARYGEKIENFFFAYIHI